MAMIFSLATTLKESAETLLHDRAHAVEKEREDHLRKEEEKEMEKFRGTLVTRERFMEWVVKFKEETARKAAAEKEKEEAEEKGKRGGGGAVVKEKRLTGMFPALLCSAACVGRELMGSRETTLREGDCGECGRFGGGCGRRGGRYCKIEGQGVDLYRAPSYPTVIETYRRELIVQCT